MSYILDALRKSDQQRQHAKAPTLLSAHSLTEPVRPTSTAIRGVLAAVLIGAGMLIGWLRPWQNDSPPGVAPATVATAEVAPSRLESIESTAGEKIEPPAIGTRLPSSFPPISSQSQSPLPAAPPVATQPAQRIDTEKPVVEVEATSAKHEPIKITQENALPTQTQLPASVQQALPGITIAFHQYSSKPDERRVMINNVVLRQGESISPGLKLEQITPDGVVIEYQGYRFQRGVR